MSRSYALGVAAAVFATFSWALNFLSSYMMGAFGPIDFITLRFIVSGCIGLVMLRIYWPGDPALSRRSILNAGLLGVLGYAVCSGMAALFPAGRATLGELLRILARRAVR